MNKNAWLLVVEVVIAIVIMFGFLLVTIVKQPQTQKFDVNAEFDYVLEQVMDNETIRNLVLANPNEATNLLGLVINPRLNLTIRNCQDSIVNCEAPQIKKNIYSTTFILWQGQGQNKLFVIYLWLKD